MTILSVRQPKDYGYTVFYERATLDFLFASLAGRRTSSEKWEATLKKAFAPSGEVLSFKSWLPLRRKEKMKMAELFFLTL